MPYIITTTPRPTHDQLVARIDGVELPDTCTAVATLEEARGVAYPVVHAAWPDATNGNSDEQRAHRWAVVAVHRLPESGGTIGPLPDGTVIEVRQVDRHDLHDLLGWPADVQGTTGAMLAAFNAS